MTNVMLDLETLGTSSTSVIIAIGAVQFDRDGIKDTFYTNVDAASCCALGLTIDPKTVMWWLEQSEDARRRVTGGVKVNLPAALLTFSSWCPKEFSLWGNGADFDNVILSNAYSACMLKQPWSHQGNRCYRTVYYETKDIIPKPDFYGVRHYALDDARNQANHLINIWNVQDQMRNFKYSSVGG